MSNIDWSKLKTAEDIAFKEQVQEKFIEHLELKSKLASTDYVTLSDYDKDKPEVLEQRLIWRNSVREIESWLEQNGLSIETVDKFLSE